MRENLTSWLLEHYGTEVMRPGLDRMREALSSLLPALGKKKIVTIAGTNGKGETTLRLSAELKNTPHQVWTSPHIERITERFRNESGEINPEKLQSLIDRCHAEVGERNLNLSYYEFLFFVFCTWAAESDSQILLLEVGLGGRLDAVNVLDANLVLIPSISRDHQEILGSRYDLILREKLGVLRSGQTLITTLQLKYLRERADLFGSELGAEIIHLDADEFDFSKSNALLAHAAYLFLHYQSLSKLPNWQFQRENLEHRGEFLRATNNFVFFGSHNPDGLRKLIQLLHSGNYTFPRPPYDLVLLAFSKRNARDLSAMLRMVKNGKLGKVVITSFDHPKALSREDAQILCRQEGLDFVFDTTSILENRSNQNILVAGSYYFLGSFKQGLRRFP